MNWQVFQTHNDAPTHAFEALCNQIFDLWCKRNYEGKLSAVTVVNGSGGDGGVESYAILNDDTIIGLQAKWFTSSITEGQFLQISNSFKTAVKVRPNIKKYIVCIPRDLASNKMGKNGKLVSYTEFTRWKNTKDKMTTLKPNIEIELWDDTRILRELQFGEAVGIYKYWFNNSELSDDVFQYSFNKQKSGWLSQKYFPSLHSRGYIFSCIRKFLGALEFREEYCDNLKRYRELCDSYIKASKDYLDTYPQNEKNEELQKEINKIQKQVVSLIGKIQSIISAIRIEATFNIDLYRTNLYTDFSNLEYLINDIHCDSVAYFHIRDIKKIINQFNTFNINEIIENLVSSFENNKLIILGNPGTGKTHGIADIVEFLIKDKQHIPILIQAKGIVTDSNWREMLIKTLAISNDWSEEELWTALEAAAFRREVNTISNKNTEYRIITKILICIDGIDESKPYNYWVDRIREIDEISKSHPRIKFCVTSRPFVFKDTMYTEACLKNHIFLNDDGDVPVKQLFDLYLADFDIKLEACPWIKWVLKTPLALRLFCEEYQGQTLHSVNRASLTINHLLQNKITKMNKEFCESISSSDSIRYQHIIHEALICIAQYLYDHNSASEETLYKLLSTNKGELSYYSDKVKILNYIENYGLLQSYCERKSTVLSIPQKNYSIGMVPFFDYIIATIFVSSNKNPNEMIVTESMSTYISALQMAAVILLEDYKYLICDNPSAKELVDSRILFDVTSFALANSSSTSANNFSDRVLSAMQHNGANGIKTIVNNVILPVSREQDHPLGASFLHKFLNSFTNVSQRDILWSIPSWLPQSEGHSWECHIDLDIFNENSGYNLCEEDEFNGLPLIYAWALTTVEQKKRVFTRNELAKWSKMCPKEFFKLFCMLSTVNDAQMREDLFSLAMGVAFTVSKDSKILADFANWILENIFSEKSVIINCNAAIRYYSQAIAERAYLAGHISENQICIARPPYRSDKLIIPTNKKALAGTRMGGYDLIDYDLSRYVLCDPIDRQFFNHYSKDGNTLSVRIDALISNFLQGYAKILEQPQITSDQFIISAAYAYVLLQGWNHEEFYGKPNGGKHGEMIGVDISIMRKYPAATHGSKSSVMTFTEKYVWSARNELMGYLADRFLFLDNDDIPCFLDDYALLDDFPNPMQEIFQSDPDLYRKMTEWYLPEDLSPDISGITKCRENLQLWINSTSTAPDFSIWLNICDKEYTKKCGMDSNAIALYNYTSLTNYNIDAESIMWVSACLIDECKFEQLKLDLLNKKEGILRRLGNPEDIYSYTKSQCYITPKEICWMPWKKSLDETYSSYSEGETLNCDYTIFKTVEKCTSNHSEFGDISYKLPSKNIRKYLSIIDGNGYKYIDKNNVTQAFYNITGEAWGDAQYYLCCNKELLLNCLTKEKKRIFWIVRLLREPSLKAREKYKDFYCSYDRCWIVWVEGTETKSQLFLDEHES